MEAKQRTKCLVTAQLTIDLVKVSIAYLQDSDEPIMPGDVLLVMALVVSEMEGRYMSAAKAAAYIGMPRPTAVRRLESLRERGMVVMHPNRRWQAKILTPDKMRTCITVVDEKIRLIHKVSADLSKMDSQPVATRYEA